MRCRASRPSQTCPFSTGGGTRRVHFVRGRDETRPVSTRGGHLAVERHRLTLWELPRGGPGARAARAAAHRRECRAGGEEADDLGRGWPFTLPQSHLLTIHFTAKSSFDRLNVGVPEGEAQAERS